ncbi:alpha/beta hydrolase [Streptomyces indicus]|uniref:TAP-like protein n=1 Tax=Streptomyces indicus TaxID=417292 RepID=A0A1G9FV06_9ACTN|nr:alpha/beta hydrolase [Streptomyces indicus]SDK92234.1 TAP-like protein [Streptomyces indicus]
MPRTSRSTSGISRRPASGTSRRPSVDPGGWTGRSSPLAAALLAAALLVAGCTSSSEPSDGKKPEGSSAQDDGKGVPDQSTIDWTRCKAPTPDQGSGKAPGSKWQCGTLQAPLDHDKPDGEKIEIALIRKPATEPDRRLGALLYNFGGPGGSGVATLPQAAGDYEDLNERYDLVSFDPRAVGETATVRCVDDKELDRLSQEDDGPPSSAAEEAEDTAESRAQVAACEKKAGKLLPHVGTSDTARDMDLIREALGEKKLNYFGISYGTELGGVYAHLFPEKVGRTVFDAVVDPTEGQIEGSLAQAKGFQLALENYFKDVGKDPEEGSAQITAVLEQAEASPLPTNSPSRKLTRGLAETGIAAALYSEETWPYLTQGLQEVENAGSGSILLLLADAYSGRDPQTGRYSNMAQANAAIRCADSNERFDYADVKRERPAFEKASPVFGASMVWGLMGCTDWPVDGERKTPEVSAKGAGPILVIGNTGDPATPVEGAKKMAEALGEGVGVNITVDGEGHGTYGVNDCATKTVDAYLLDGEVPADGKTCK